MELIKEIWELMRMLFSNIKDVDDVETYSMKYFPFSRYKYIMWCGKLIYRSEHPEFKELHAVDWNHESIHLMQAKDRGSWFLYYISYIWNWFKHNPFSHKAYYLNRYEIEAYSKEDDFDYLDRRTYKADKKFELKNASKIFEQLKLSMNFKNYIKNIFKDI